MRSIVFATITENIKSFFQQEKELTAKPKIVPESASEALGQTKIIEQPLPVTAQRSTQLPFSPEQLRNAINRPAQSTPPYTASNHITHETIDTTIERDISQEIAAFETALQEHTPQNTQRLQQTTRTTPPLKSMSSITQPSTGQSSLQARSGFFSEFEQFIAREDLETEGIIGKDLLWRMKEFHKHRQEGKEYYVFSKDVQTAIQRKVEYLKKLEQEWFLQQEQKDILEKNTHLIEQEIEAYTTELKTLLEQAKNKSRLEGTTPQGQEFVLSDGRKLASLLDLKIALKTMPDTVFSTHVTAIKHDFAAWVRGAMNDAQLANELEKIKEKSPLEMYLGKLAG